MSRRIIDFLGLLAEGGEGTFFGYTCVNDVTAVQFLFADQAFQQWTFAKVFDNSCPLGLRIDTDIDPAELRVLAIENSAFRRRERLESKAEFCEWP